MKKKNHTDSPAKSFLKQFQYESETEDNKMTRSRQTSASPTGDKEQPKEGRMRKALKKESVKTKTSS